MSDNIPESELTDAEKALRDSPAGAQIDAFLADPFGKGVRRGYRPQRRQPETSSRSEATS